MFLTTKKDTQILQMLYQLLVSYKHCAPFPEEGTDEQNRLARIVANTLHDLNPVWTGFVSQRALQYIVFNNASIGTLCYEHFKSRQKCGKDTLDFIKHNNPDQKQFNTFIGKMCLTHRTLRNENTNVEQYQRTCDHWVDAYQLADIKLIDVGVRKQLRFEHLRNCKGVDPTPLQTVDQIIHDPKRYEPNN